jgi:hypothetical protein
MRISPSFFEITVDVTDDWQNFTELAKRIHSQPTENEMHMLMLLMYGCDSHSVWVLLIDIVALYLIR